MDTTCKIRQEACRDEKSQKMAKWKQVQNTAFRDTVSMRRCGKRCPSMHGSQTERTEPLPHDRKKHSSGFVHAELTLMRHQKGNILI